ncbi:MAG TPA: fructose bisphosphate aldolase [Acidimicrobiales bacterium]|nr:fructose bisphosphate aldolase [Acidimicrobiales bacterium]
MVRTLPAEDPAQDTGARPAASRCALPAWAMEPRVLPSAFDQPSRWPGSLANPDLDHMDRGKRHVDRRRRVNDDQFQKVEHGSGFIAALDQSGGSTPKALEAYGIDEDRYSDDDEMFALMHAMRSRIIQSPSFDGNHIIGAILFEDTMDREIGGRNSVSYLWDVKRIVPFLKVDKGLAPERDGVQIMSPIPGLAPLLSRANANGVFGTKMRSFIRRASDAGINAVVDQQFEFAQPIMAAGLIPIIEPEIDINSPEKGDAEQMLKANIVKQLAQLGSKQHVILKLSLPEVGDFYADLVGHPNVVRVVALSGGYDREEADWRLAANYGVIASFSRALTEGLSVDQSQGEFDATLKASIDSIYTSSLT